MANPAVTVRMYNVGFGDCFLLLIPGEERTAKILIDCGSHFLGAGPRPIGEVARQIVTDVTAEDGVARIDVVVATHRHQDHVSGFTSEAWRDVEVGEVWMPWTEDPEDDAAEQIREQQSRLAAAIAQAIDRLSQAGVTEGDDLELIQALALNSLTNERAMSTLHFGFAGRARRRFLSGLQEPLEPIQGLPRVTVHVLGPSRDPAVIARMRPPSEESFLRLVASGDDVDAGGSLPFDRDWSISVEEFRADPAFAQLQPGGQVVGMLRKLTRDGVVLTAASLEDAVNNTSLMLLFEVGRALLLFPGDSQWGTWELLLEDTRARRLLSRTSFYKVGHHGSHNASPVSYVKNLGADSLAAAISVKPVERWRNIPKAELVEALEEKTRGHVIRMDQLPAEPVDGVTIRDDVSVDMTIEV
jgi:beta-lactamase superfamily II metal-dependent hydrolase